MSRNQVRDYYEIKNSWQRRNELFPAATGAKYTSTPQAFTGTVTAAKARAMTLLAMLMPLLAIAVGLLIVFVLSKSKSAKMPAGPGVVVAVGWAFVVVGVLMGALLATLAARATSHVLTVETRGIRFVHGKHDIRARREDIQAIYLRGDSNFQLLRKDGTDWWVIGGHSAATKVAQEATRRLGIPLTPPPS